MEGGEEGEKRGWRTQEGRNVKERWKGDGKQFMGITLHADGLCLV